MSRATDIISLYDSELSKAANFHSLYQDVADLMFPRSNQITRRDSPGQEKTKRITDSTAIMASLEMANGLAQNLVAPSQPFFALRVVNRAVNVVEDVRIFLSQTTDIMHEKLFGSNFMLQLNQTLRAFGVFGTGNLFSEYTTFLNFKDYDVGMYLPIENSKGRIDTVMLKFEFTAAQATEEWGDNAGKSVVEAMKDEKKAQTKFEFIHKVSPRKDRIPRFRDALNMEFESVFVSVKDKVEVSEGGFREFPYHIARWTKASNEVFGRGQGTFSLPDVRMLETMRRDHIEAANKHVNPPLQVLDGFEGELKVFPGAVNYVTELPMITAIPRDAMGNFVISKEVVDAQQELVRKAFFNDVFNQLGQLTGDRRTTVEIRERIGEGLQRLGQPIGRLHEELFSPMITRVFFLLERNGQLPEIPEALVGQTLEIEYISRLALELRSHQARGGQQWLFTLGEMEQVAPGIMDNVDTDGIARRLGETLGVHADDIRPIEQVEAIRQQRAEQEAAQRTLELAAGAAEAVGKASKAPEEGSPAKEVMEALGV